MCACVCVRPAAQVNHEIDIEIPASCVGALDVCNVPSQQVPGAFTCIGQFNTANLNNYIYTQTSGTGAHATAPPWSALLHVWRPMPAGLAFFASRAAGLFPHCV